MTTDDFSSPIYMQDEPELASDLSASAAAAGSDQEIIDPNDPSLLQQEITEFDPNADPYAVPPPIPDGFWRVKLKAIDSTGPNRQKVRFLVKQEMNYPGKGAPGIPVFLPNGKPKMYVGIALEASVQDPTGTYDNLKLYDRFMDSRTNRQGAVPMVWLLRVLKAPVPAPLTNHTLVEAVLKVLAGEPECDIESQWEGQASQEDAEALKAKNLRAPRVRGMNRFPESGGKRVPEISQEVAGYGKIVLRAQAQIVGYYPVGTKTGKKAK